MPKVPVIDIRPHDLETVRGILRRHVPGYEVWAFGSRVRWSAREYSDLDLAIRSDEEIPWDVISAIKNELSESNLPMMVDVLDMAGVSEKFRGIIEEEYAVVQESSFVHALDECAVLVRDNIDPKNASGMPYIGLEHIEEGTLHLKGNGLAEDVTSAKLKFKKGDILFGKLRPYFRKVIRAPFDGVCSTDIWVVRAKPGVAQGYVFYWMASDGFVNFANSGSEGTRMPRAKWQYAAKHKQKKIPLEKQRKIAHILGTLDDKIELNRQMNKTLEAMARTIFKSWFVDFAPVHAKAKGRNTGLPPEVADLFPDGFEDSELGEIPRGWGVKPLEEVAEIIGGGTPSTKDEKNFGGDIPWITPRDLSGYTARYISRGERNITAKGLAESSAKMLPENSVVLSTRAPVGYLAIAKNPLTTNQGFRSLVVKDGFDPVFVYYLLRNNVEYLKSHASGSTFGELRGSTLKSLRFVFPPYAGQISITRILGTMDDNIEQASNTLAALRDTLIPMLLSGQIPLAESNSAR